MRKRALTRLKLLVGAMALACAGVAGATTLDTNAGGTGDGLLQNFIGFDWHSDGQAWIQGFDLTSANTTGDTDAFTLDYHGFAGNIFTSSALLGNLNIPPPNGAGAGTYEITLVAHLNEVAQCTAANCSSIGIGTSGGNFTVYIDYKPDAMANPIAGTGYANTGSIILLQGVFTGGLATFLSNGILPGNPGAGGTGGGSIFALVTFSNGAFIDPSLLSAGATTQTSLQFGPFVTADYNRSACMELAGATGTTGGLCTAVPGDSSTSFMLQADASTTFVVPEPGTLALLGLGLLGLGAVRRKIA